MKTILLTSVAAFGIFAPSSFAADYDANYCEIFIDKVEAISGSHGIRRLVLYMKTLNERLDAEIDEVGMRYKTSGGYRIYGEDIGKWYNVKMKSFLGATDYFTLSLPITHDYTDPISYQAAFYLRTKNGTTLWLKDRYHQDFSFNLDGVNSIFEMQRVFGNAHHYSSNPDNAISAQDHFGGYYNPNGCY